MSTQLTLVILQFIMWVNSSQSAVLMEIHTFSGLTAVPEHLNHGLTTLILSDNDISCITNTSLANYTNMTELIMTHNSLDYIQDGSFDHNPKLQTLDCRHNKLRYIPADFGPATSSLINIDFYNGMKIALKNLNFSQFFRLRSLRLGGNPLQHYDANNIPSDINHLNIRETQLTVIPNLSPYAPRIKDIKIHINDIQYISTASLSGLAALRQLNIQLNQLETLPDLFDKPLNLLCIDDNPIHCNVSLCWVRLWAKKKATALKKISSARCNTPKQLQGQNLMDVDPVQMKCFKGRFEQSMFPRDPFY